MAEAFHYGVGVAELVIGGHVAGGLVVALKAHLHFRRKRQANKIAVREDG